MDIALLVGAGVVFLPATPAIRSAGRGHLAPRELHPNSYPSDVPCRLSQLKQVFSPNKTKTPKVII